MLLTHLVDEPVVTPQAQRDICGGGGGAGLELGWVETFLGGIKVSHILPNKSDVQSQTGDSNLLRPSEQHTCHQVRHLVPLTCGDGRLEELFAAFFICFKHLSQA